MPETTVINIRIQKALLERFDRYLDSEARWNRTDINRATVIRELVETFLNEPERLRYERPQADRLEDISALENAGDTLEAQAQAHAAEFQRLREELEQTRRDLAADRATIVELRSEAGRLREHARAKIAAETQAQTLEQQLETIRTDQQVTTAKLEDWIQRATIAETELKAMPSPAPKKAAARKSRSPSAGKG